MIKYNFLEGELGWHQTNVDVVADVDGGGSESNSDGILTSWMYFDDGTN